MIKVKVFTANENGKIEFTKEELEQLLNEVANDSTPVINWGTGVINTPLQVSTTKLDPPKYKNIIECNNELNAHSYTTKGENYETY